MTAYDPALCERLVAELRAEHPCASGVYGLASQLARQLEAASAHANHATKKWRDYEDNYILPAFRWAERENIDLPSLVSAHPGHNCVELLVTALINERDALRADNERMRTVFEAAKAGKLIAAHGTKAEGT